MTDATRDRTADRTDSDHPLHRDHPATDTDRPAVGATRRDGGYWLFEDRPTGPAGAWIAIDTEHVAEVTE